jgi:aromatic-L-amino-acid decarboxylase
MDIKSFRDHGHELIDWVADYMESVEKYPVMSRVKPGEISDRLPHEPPDMGEPMAAILKDFEEVLMPGVTHWQHPGFFAYFPANTSGPSILAELITSALGINAMVWQTSPAATELEERVMEWLRMMLRLPDEFRGVIQDTASTATICALLCARESAAGFGINEKGFCSWPMRKVMRVYTSEEAHSSVEKGAKIVGFGAENVVRIAVDSKYAMDPGALEEAIRRDEADGYKPCCVCATVGTTSSTAIDPLREIGEIAKRRGLWFHIDAALAGSAAILPEKRSILDGVETADSFVFNPHKWLFTNFDCSAFFVKDVETLIRVFSIDPEYLKTRRDSEVVNFRDWGIQLGRRFRALKLWFVIRSYGVEGLRERLRAHLALAQDFGSWVEKDPGFELLAPVEINTICFRFRPRDHGLEEKELEELNRRIMDSINAEGKIYITHTRLGGRFTLRVSIGQTYTRGRHVENAWRIIRRTAATVMDERSTP